MECNLPATSLLFNGKELIPELFIAVTARQRTRGLLGYSKLTEEQGLLIEKCTSIHMVGMKYAIDLCYLSKEGQVLKTVSHVKPWRFSACLRADCVIEMLAGMNDKLKIRTGMHVLRAQNKFNNKSVRGVL